MPMKAAYRRDDFPSSVSRGRIGFPEWLDGAMRLITSFAFFILSVVVALAFLAAGLWMDFPRPWIDGVVVVSAFLMLTPLIVLENTNRHSHLAAQLKLNALALAIMSLMTQEDQREARDELRRAIGVERHVNPKGVRD